MAGKSVVEELNSGDFRFATANGVSLPELRKCPQGHCTNCQSFLLTTRQLASLGRIVLEFYSTEDFAGRRFWKKVEV
ncbi:hypothetical protein ACFX2I_045261 [Malus domestica]